MKIESIKAHDGTNLRVARFEPSAKAVGVVQILHGFGEGLAYYIHMADFFTENGYVCVLHDQRGFGEMPDMSQKEKRRARGVVPGYEYLIEDVKTLCDKIKQWYPGLPATLFGHSMGGNIAANYILKNDGYHKVILGAPWLRLYKPLPKVVTSIARLGGKISPRITVPAGLKIDDITRNRDMAHDLRTDGIFHDQMSLRLYSEVVEAGEYAIKNAAKISVPTLLLCPGMDKIVCPNAIREFAAQANKNVVIVEYPDGYHGLYVDIVRNEVLAAMLNFCNGIG